MQHEVLFCSSVGGLSHIESLAAHVSRLGILSREYGVIPVRDYWTAANFLKRWRLRSMMYAEYPARFLCEFGGRRRDVTYVVTTNPFLMPYLASVCCKNSKTRVINLLYDLFPDALELDGLVQKDSLVARGLATITAGALKRCDATVYLGERLQSYAERTYGPSRKSVVIPVGADGRVFKDTPPTPRRSDAVTVLYSGNMGRLHDYKTMQEALRLLGTEVTLQCGGERAKKLRIEIFGKGAGYTKFKEQSADMPCGLHEELIFGPNLNYEQWAEQMKQADVAFVSMTSGSENILMPSKAYSALVAGQAILAVCPKESDLADLIIKHDCGWVVSIGDVKGLAQILREIRSHPEILLQKRKNAFYAGHEHYEMRVIAKRWFELINELWEQPVSRLQAGNAADS